MYFSHINFTCPCTVHSAGTRAATFPPSAKMQRPQCRKHSLSPLHFCRGHSARTHKVHAFLPINTVRNMQNGGRKKITQRKGTNWEKTQKKNERNERKQRRNSEIFQENQKKKRILHEIVIISLKDQFSLLSLPVAAPFSLLQ